MKPQSPPRERAASSRGRRYAWALAALLLGAIAILWWGRPKNDTPSEDDLLKGATPTRERAHGEPPRPRPNLPWTGPRGPQPSEEEPPGGDPKTAMERRLERVERALSSYLETTKYPFDARPIREQPDQIKPHHVSPTQLPLARDDKKLTDAKVTLYQDRYFVVGDEQVVFSIACENSDGPAPCEVLSAAARIPPPEPGAGSREARLRFADDGQNGDRAAGDGAVAATFAPAAQGFEGYHGRVHVDVDLRVESESGRTTFEIEYTPSTPATFTGEVREQIEDGSLAFYVGMDVKKAGRYVLRARVSTAGGEPFAYLSFNDDLGEGRKEARLLLFGKLILDEKAKAPFELRDVEGFRLIPDAHPDRELMPLIEGVAHTSKAYADRDFSDKEWQSEEKDRYVRELQKDVEESKKRLESGAPSPGGSP